MSLVDDQRGSGRFTQGGVLGQRRLITLHAEERLGDDECVANGSVLFEQTCQCADIVMGKDDSLGVRKTNAIDQAGMVALVGKDDVAGFRERRQHSNIGEIPAREIERALCPLEPRECPLDTLEALVFAPEQAGTSAAASLEPDARNQVFLDARVLRQAKVVVRAEVEPCCLTKASGQPGFSKGEESRGHAGRERVNHCYSPDRADLQESGGIHAGRKEEGRQVRRLEVT
jgi:hypothetical protein